MRRRNGLTQMPSRPTEWTRRQVQGLLAILTMAAVLGVGVVLLITSLNTHPTGRDGASRPTPGPSLPSEEDRIANASLPSAPVEAARPGRLATDSFPPIAIPSASLLGPAGVPSGFPQTVQGAIAQLAAIDQAALEGASVSRAQEIVRAWAAPGGPTDESWSGVQAIAMLLSAAGLPANAKDAIDIRAIPAMALVKGQLGAISPTGGAGNVQFVVPCLELVVTATIGEKVERIAVSDCQRMNWRGDRWVIGPGPEPTPAPSLWPGSSASYDVGFRWIEMSSA